jgi:hypothetical protein
VTEPSSLYALTGEPAPPTPVLIVALDGWVDSGMAGGTAMTALLEANTTRPYATFDGEDLIDQRARRPTLHIRDGLNDDIVWPELTIRVGEDRLGSGIAVLTGPEPDFRWKTFARAVAEISTAMGVRLMAGLGGFPAAAPHTRPVRLACTATTLELAQKVGFINASIDVLSGIEAVLEREMMAAGIPAVGLWARVPHYVTAMPYPAASVALLDGLASVSGLVIDSHVLAEAADAARQKIDEVIAENREHIVMVRQLEAAVDAVEGEEPGFSGLEEGVVPTGDEIAAEFEKYLRGESGGAEGH